jgi:phenolic acid decarboxylase
MITNEQNSVTKNLTGRGYEYTYTSGMSCKLSFTETKANWEIVAGPNKDTSDSNDYIARVVEEGVYFVQWNEPELKVSVTLLIHEPKKKVYGSVVWPDGSEFDVAEIHKVS